MGYNKLELSLLGFTKDDPRLREEKISELLPKLDLSKRADFEGDKNTPSRKIEKLEKDQQEIMARLQKPETGEFLDLVDYINRLIQQRTFSWTRLLNDLETLIPSNLQIISIRPQITGNEIGIEIIANGRSSHDYIEFISKLESSGKFYNVNPIYEDISKSPGLVGRLINISVRYKGQT